MALTSQIVKDKEATVVAKTMAMPLPKGKKKLKSTSLADDASEYVKALVQGNTGTGKSFTLAEIAQTETHAGTPTKIFVASTDIGGNGLKSVKDRLLAVGRSDLIANIEWVEFPDYKTFAAFTTNPDDVVEIQGKSFWEWDPDVIAWDGLANFQESHIWRYIMAMDALAKDSHETRDEGVQAGMAEWGQIRRCTILQIDQFIALHNPSGKKIHKLVTCLMDSGKESKLTHEVQKGPLIMGAARDYVGPAFDFILTAEALVKPGSKAPEFRYQCNVGSNVMAKVRGAAIPPEVLAKADMKTIWEILTRKEVQIHGSN